MTILASFFSLNNPIFFSLVIILFLLIITYIFSKYVIIPMQKKHIAKERDIRLENAKLMALFAELDPDPVLRFNNEGKILMTNDAGANLIFDHTPVGKKIDAIVPALKDISIQRCIANGETHQIITAIAGKTYRLTVQGFSGLNFGQVYCTDITELKKVEENLNKALKKAEESEELKTNFLLQVSHEIRSPLMALLGFSELVREEINGSNSNLDYAFKSIQNSGKRIYRTIDLTLNMSRILTGDYIVNSQRLNVTEAINKLLLDFIPAAKEKGLSIVFEDKAENAVIATDNYSFELIIQNLIDNAIKYTVKGGVTIRTRFDEEGNFKVDVEDTGIGISEEYRDRIYKPFSQEEMGYNRPFDGMGLGLALVKNLCNMLNATVSYVSEKNKGTTFSVIFKQK